MPRSPRIPVSPPQFPRSWPRTVLSALLLFSVQAGRAAGIYEDGVSARSQALGGVGVAGGQHALDALGQNPAALRSIAAPRAELGLGAGSVDGSFSNRANDGSELHDFGGWGLGAVAFPVGPVTLGFGVLADDTLRADWRFRDAPGGLDGTTTYGTRAHKSEIAVIRFSFGAACQITPNLSAGASFGLLYNRNRLESPYTIQSEPHLAGAKTLLDLETEGWGAAGQFGLLWKPRSDLQFGVSYTLQSRIESSGRAYSDARTQLRNLGLSGVNSTATFDADVTNTLPQILSAASARHVTPRLHVLAQVDWINWSAAFDTLEVRLRHTRSPLYRQLLGQRSNLDDDIRLDWEDQWVARLGLEYTLSPHWQVRLGYRYSPNPVPAETLTPLTAVTSEHLVSAGLGWKSGPFSIDLAYQWQLPQSEHVEHTRLRQGEYARSDVRISIHRFALTLAYQF